MWLRHFTALMSAGAGIAPYRMHHDQVLDAFQGYIVAHEPISGVFAPALGDYGYLIRSPHLDELCLKLAAWLNRLIRIARTLHEYRIS
jgi:hypothetical protein